MKRYPIDKIRNLGLISHGGAGKTSLAEAMLFDAGIIDRLGRVDNGTATMDFEPEEVKRKISISAGIAPLEWKGHKVTLVDTPGYFDFVGEVKGALRVVDAALVVVDAVAGVEVGTELTWRYAEDINVPRTIVINKMDRENANFDKTLASLEEAFGRVVVPIQLPIGAEANFKGVVDIIKRKAYLAVDGGKKVQEAEVPGDLKAEADSLRERLMEAAAEADDELTLKYLEGEPMTDEEMVLGLRKGIAAGKIVPVLCVSSLKNIGIQNVLDTAVDYLPSPADLPAVEGANPKTNARESRAAKDTDPFSALVFKTMADPFVGKLNVFRVYSGVLKSDSHVYNVTKGRSERIGQIFIPKGKAQEPVTEVGAGDIAAVAKLQDTSTNDTLADEAKPIILPRVEFPKPVYQVAVLPKAKGDEEKIGSGLNRLTEEDPTLKVERSTTTGQTIVYGVGDSHLDVISDRLRRKFGVETVLEMPRVPYKETIRGSAKVEGRHKKQSGGRGQYGHVWIEFEPLPDQDFEFVDKIFGGSVPLQYRPAVEKGLRECLAEGVLAGYPTTSIRATLCDGSYHDVDSSEMAFKIAASLAFKKGMMEAKPVLLEPIVSVEVTVPDANMGDVIGDLNKKRGKILGMEPQGRNQIVKALVPMAEMFRYAIDLRSITQGRGTYAMTFDHYEEIPANVAQAIIAEANKDRQEKE